MDSISKELQRITKCVKPVVRENKQDIHLTTQQAEQLQYWNWFMEIYVDPWRSHP